MENSLAAILWDLDGTLAETERHGHRVAYNQAFRALGLDWHWSPGEYGRLLEIAGGRERLGHFLQGLGDRAPDPADRAQLIENIMRNKGAALATLVAAGGITPRPGVARLVAEAAAAGVPLALVTTAAGDSARRLLPALLGSELAARFIVRVTAEDARNKKPDPEGYRRCLAELGVPAARCVAVEDSRNGLLAAHRAGIPVLVTPSEYNRSQQFDEAALVVDALGDPGQPCRVLQGQLAGDREMVDLAVLNALLG
ncbi:MAG: HAD-IA family hydrolase [Gammaproteobacteria bacterium]|jgi:HAD superfamily hydrolase (TIGR01509 family)|nr:HAD-IA family hydrolase [Gammaproteobacteria bacterium]